jgi:hypothetical protein
MSSLFDLNGPQHPVLKHSVRAQALLDYHNWDEYQGTSVLASKYSWSKLKQICHFCFVSWLKKVEEVKEKLFEFVPPPPPPSP